MMGVADNLERAAELYAQGGGLAAALAEVAGPSSAAFVDAKDALLKGTRFVTLGDYVALRGQRETIVEDLRRAAAVARGQVRP